ncbi:MAG: hypothetical protein HQL52_15975 [Magnetococcales bacterium]|nr:hypothetical protein [Magnetococcales bacterium]
MLWPRTYGFLTGLHFALLQFGYLYVLQINITSTYLTYGLVVLLWMVGSLVGLWWWGKSRALESLLVGLGAYYGVGLLAFMNPFSTAILPLAGVGVALSGFWAGGFFPFMQGSGLGMDGVFFHENNGFLLGIGLCFVGVTLIGRPALIWFPLVTGGGLIVWSRIFKS